MLYDKADKYEYWVNIIYTCKLTISTHIHNIVSYLCDLGLDQWNFVMHPVDAAFTCDPKGNFD